MQINVKNRLVTYHISFQDFYGIDFKYEKSIGWELELNFR